MDTLARISFRPACARGEALDVHVLSEENQLPTRLHTDTVHNSRVSIRAPTDAAHTMGIPDGGGRRVLQVVCLEAETS